jgi:hypothetical protein
MWLGGIAIFPVLVFAQYTSTNYQSNEVQFGVGGDNSQASTNYSSSVSVGSLGVGNTSSTSYQAYSGFLTPNEPFLSMTINTSTVPLGTLTTSTTATGTATFTITVYVDSGYTVQTVSTPPKYTSGATSHTLTGMAQAATTIGKEEFGINLRANTSPASFGADPANQPAGSGTTFANGQAATGYSTANQYKYTAGDTIACTGTGGTCGNASGWGQTIYTISYIADISPATPAGDYSVTQDLVAVATY